MTTRPSNTETLVKAVHAFPPTHGGVWRQVRVGWEKNSSSHRGMLQNKTKQNKEKQKYRKMHSWNIIYLECLKRKLKKN